MDVCVELGSLITHLHVKGIPPALLPPLTQSFVEPSIEFSITNHIALLSNCLI